jgi:L-alanine-DL-glutamate epimerase-like enolase superfamily enzyme
MFSMIKFILNNFKNKNFMATNRREFIAGGISLGICSMFRPGFTSSGNSTIPVDEFEKVIHQPVLDKSSFASPIIIESIELLKCGELYMVHTRAKNGAEGAALASSRAAYLYPIFQQLVAPYFIDKDARDIESLVDGVYVYNSNYKMSCLALWCCVAWLEFSILDMLGKIAGKPVGDMLGGRIRNEISLYMASGRRNTTPEEEISLLEQSVAESCVKAVKFKLGGRMSNNEDALPGRTEGLIRLARKELGDAMVIYADANGSYDAVKAVEIGRILEEIGASIFEEPCPFDHFEETKKVADILKIAISGGEQESSMRRFRWLIVNDVLQMVQPDLHYFGGLIRCTKVARMAELAGLPVTVHVTGASGFIDMLHFSSYIPNLGPFQELKGNIRLVGPLYGLSPEVSDGKLKVPQGNGWGLLALDDLLRDSKIM